MSDHQVMSVAFAQCLGVRYKQDQAKISLYPCNKESEFQKWGCINSTLVIHGENLFLSIGKRKKDNIVLDSGSGTMNKWKIFGTTDDLCSQDYKGKAWRLVLIVSCDCLPSQAGSFYFCSSSSKFSCSPWSNGEVEDNQFRQVTFLHPKTQRCLASNRIQYMCKKLQIFIYFQNKWGSSLFFFLIFSFKLSTLVYLIGW